MQQVANNSHTMVQTPLRFLMFAVAGAAMIVNEALLKKYCEF
jgi:hypothetical protein